MYFIDVYLSIDSISIIGTKKIYENIFCKLLQHRVHGFTCSA